ncbi:MAG: hypothetical protein HYT49_02965 [Candidatus Wildermuthbacteria bacterium]|nr:hypothetical protein [Candidatus Wildermuthbacteria bacterium]
MNQKNFPKIILAVLVFLLFAGGAGYIIFGDTISQKLKSSENKEAVQVPSETNENTKEIPNGSVAFIKNSQLFLANFDGSEPELSTNDPVFIAEQSPDGKYIVYVERLANSSEEVTKIVDVNTRVVSQIVSHPRRLATNEIFASRPRWSSKGTIVAWQLTQRREGQEVNNLEYYDLQEREIHYVKNPSTDYIEFGRIYNFELSSSGQFIAVLGDMQNEAGEMVRGIALYDTSKDQSTTVMLETPAQTPVRDEMFFDANEYLHYGVLAEAGGPQPNVWITYNTSVGTRDVATIQPAYWNNLRYGVRSFLGDKVAALCPSIPGDICVADRNGLQSRVIVSRDALGLSDMYIGDFFFSADSQYIIFRAGLKNAPGRLFLWSIPSDGGTPRQILEL